MHVYWLEPLPSFRRWHGALPTLTHGSNPCKAIDIGRYWYGRNILIRSNMIPYGFEVGDIRIVQLNIHTLDIKAKYFPIFFPSLPTPFRLLTWDVPASPQPSLTIQGIPSDRHWSCERNSPVSHRTCMASSRFWTRRESTSCAQQPSVRPKSGGVRC